MRANPQCSARNGAEQHDVQPGQVTIYVQHDVTMYVQHDVTSSACMLFIEVHACSVACAAACGATGTAHL